ncbi:MAG: helix-turn-helix domain-containing protein [Alphaproteobacteria bacterium]|nr:helix-turn-helix domain-containing protein [Alphaproteobacteria bacterium]MBM3950611.1 helix-turn-helix domain-containing protein [Rhodospirillales bacterium]
MKRKKLNKTESSILRGMKQALAYARGDKRGSVTHIIKVPQVDVRAARRKLGMTQKDFALSFGVSLDTLRNWEQGRRRPEGSARVLLAVIERDPTAVLKAVRDAA